MKKYISKTILAASVLMATACVDDLTSLNVNPKAYQSGLVPEGPFFANASRNVVDQVTYGMNFKIWSQQFAQTTYFTTSNYTLTDVGSGFWSSLYQSVLIDYKEAKKILTDNPSFYAGVDQNKMAQIEIMEVFTYSLLVTTYGDIPYSGALNTSLKAEALDPDNLTPAYDDGEEVFYDLLDRLDAAIADLDPDVDNGGDLGFGASDLLFGDDITLWIKFANSLKLRMGMFISDSNPSLAKSIVESISASDLITSNAEIAQLQYLSTTPNTNPIWVGLIQSGREDYVASNTMMDIMQEPAVDDPRIPEYYTLDNFGGYSGGTYGTSNAYVNFSKAGAKVTSATWPGILIDYTEVEFLLAEALAKGFTVAGTIAEHYENGIRASMDYWGVAEADADLYIADPDVAYATAIGSTDLQKIARQKYIAMFNRGFEAWGDYRRFDYPVYNVPPNPGGPFPVRYTYPVAEQTSNGESYTEAAAAIGGDDLDVKLFWDVN
ncbi:SusD/RagB family nutrient-binding outer membrane lipoprotein [Algoriphagus zhangzhouensis]|uniref:Starch-binding associating with outer membrane n=1 Tax=Algoriphagus zhangzhouensis TaxID=1073327 RepID=A0A1M7ZEK4_9BACT|nr:SusD/RagB family nutrient-binding outer membrane lipoprotein [Algoriphagus zhangzhouensis]TDY46055.1 SusD-like starch-binding protein associating with outer membrane [Algoriphagus zhangzhouensis]SHO63298.1 Starch-binding associating with outer membrane [Algoriphagus zhangzhouensis]